jgi:hypothetical protein
MRLRQRHWNPARASATLALDSRFTSFANGSAVDTWASRHSSNDASQSVSADRPSFETGSYNGNPSVVFDGSSDFLTWTTVNTITALTVFKAAGAQTDYAALFGNSTTVQQLFVSTFKWNDFNFANFWDAGTWRKNGTTFSPRDNNSLSTDTDIVSIVLTGARSVNQTRDRSLATRVPNGRVFQYCLFTDSLSTSLLKRAHHHAAFSFKISCN